MKPDIDDFNTLVQRAMSDHNFSHMAAVVEKELLHYDILFSLDQAGLLDALTFQGGTSLRLCYGSNRLSEDLNFAGGKDFCSTHLTTMKNCIENYIGQHYGLEVRVKEPVALKTQPQYAELKVNKWQIAIVTAPQRKDIPQQKIKIEVANVPAYTRMPLPLRVNYDFLPDGYSDILILTESLDEIMADKLISLAATQTYVRNRDIWDLPWLKQQGAVVRLDLIQRKISDYRLNRYPQMLDSILERLPEIVTGQQFKGEMKRFTPASLYNRTLNQAKFETFLINSVTAMLNEVKSILSDKKGKPEFIL